MFKLMAVSWAFPPLLFPRSIQMGRLLNAFVEKQVDVSVLCAEPDPSFGRIDYVLDGKVNPMIKRLSTGFAYNRYITNGLDALSAGWLYLPDHQRFWIKNVFKTYQTEILNSDLLFTVSNPVSDHLLGLEAKRKCPDLPWVAFFSDPWVGNPYGHYNKNHWVARKNMMLEKSVVENADALVFVTQETLAFCMAKYPAHLYGKAHVIPHLFNADDYPANKLEGGKIVIRHIGNFYGDRTPETFFKALCQLLREDQTVETIFSVEMYGRDKRVYRDWITYYGLENIVQMKGVVSFHKSIEKMATADVLLIIDAPGKENLFLPSKMMDYLGSRRPILALTPGKGATARLVNELGFFQADFNDIGSIKNYLRQFKNMKLSGEIFPFPPESVYRQYESKHVAGVYLALFSSLIGSMI